VWPDLLEIVGSSEDLGAQIEKRERVKREAGVGLGCSHLAGSAAQVIAEGLGHNGAGAQEVVVL
jgi:hypothetical protein